MTAVEPVVSVAAAGNGHAIVYHEDDECCNFPSETRPVTDADRRRGIRACAICAGGETEDDAEVREATRALREQLSGVGKRGAMALVAAGYHEPADLEGVTLGELLATDVASKTACQLVGQFGDGALVTDGGVEMIEACPVCETAAIHVKSGRGNYSKNRQNPEQYYCKNGHHFDEPDERKRKGHGTPQSAPHAAALIEADPDDLATDGGEEPAFHVVCHNCPFERLTHIENRAKNHVSGHEFHYSGHDVEYARIDRREVGGKEARTCDFCGIERATVEEAIECCSEVLDDEPELISDGGRETLQFVVRGFGSFSYGPGRDHEPGDWMLGCGTEEGRVEVLVDEEAMYDLWTEVQHVPWPRDGTECGELQRDIFERVQGMDEEMCRELLAKAKELGGEPA